MLKSLTSDYVASSSQYEGVFNEDKYSDYIEYFYRGLSPENQLIFAHTIGYAGLPQLDVKGIARKVNKPVQYVKDQQKLLAKNFRAGLRTGTF
jgi:hypothetical protein